MKGKHRPLFKDGDKVAWRSQSGGKWSEKCGRVLGILESGKRVSTLVEDVGMYKMQCDPISHSDRYVVVVPRVGKSGNPIASALYAPRIKSVNDQMMDIYGDSLPEMGVREV